MIEIGVLCFPKCKSIYVLFLSKMCNLLGVVARWEAGVRKGVGRQHQEFKVILSYIVSLKPSWTR